MMMHVTDVFAAANRPKHYLLLACPTMGTPSTFVEVHAPAVLKRVAGDKMTRYTLAMSKRAL